jgi:hypothetical protein
MFVNIITPCSRPENLSKIADSIKLSPYNYQWIIIHDAETIPTSIIDLKVEALHLTKRDINSISGNAQRNTGLDLLGNRPDSWIYFNDDDTAIHPDLWDAVKENSDCDFIHFMQETATKELRLDGKDVMITKVDSHNFIFKTKLLGDTRWKLDDYCADGYFAEAIYKKAKNPIYVSKVLSTYNSLR